MDTAVAEHIYRLDYFARKLRLRIARLAAPAGADVHDPDATACASELVVLDAAEAWDLHLDPGGRVVADVTKVAEDAVAAGWIEQTTDYKGSPLYQLTAAGSAQQARLRRAPRARRTGLKCGTP
jgi:hypothetical protein